MYTCYIPKLMKFFHSMKFCEHNTLIKESFECSKTVNSDWLQGLLYALHTLHLEPYFENKQIPSANSIKKLAKDNSWGYYLTKLMSDNTRTFAYEKEEHIEG